MIKQIVEPFKNRNVAAYFSADWCFFLGFWISYLNMSWLTYSLTHSPLSLGILGFAINIPLPFLLPVGGVIADRVNRRTFLIWMQMLCIAPPALLTASGYFGFINFYWVLGCGFLYGALFALTNPSSYTFIKDIVHDEQQLHRVISLVGANVKATQFIAAAVNSLLHFIISTTEVFAVSAILHMGSLASFLGIRSKRQSPPSTATSPLTALRKGLHYVRSHSAARDLMFIVGLTSSLTISYLFQLPYFADTVFRHGVHMLNYLYLVGGFGGIAGSLFLSAYKNPKGTMRRATLLLILLGVSMVLFAYTRNVFVALLTSFFIDAGLVAILAAANATLQLIIEPEMTGRVMGLNGFATYGLIPVFSLLIGVLSHRFGPQIVIATSGAIITAAAFLYWVRLRHHHRTLIPFYAKMKTPPENRPI